MKKTNKSLYEAFSDIRGIAGANKSGLIPKDEITAVSAAFQDEGQRLSKRYIDVAIDQGVIDLEKTGLPQVPGSDQQVSAPKAGPNPLKSQPFVDSLHQLNPEDLQKLRNLLLTRAGMKQIAAEGVKDFFSNLAGKAARGLGKVGALPQGMGRAIKRGYQSGVTGIGGSEQTFQQIARQVANVDSDQAKAIIGYIDNILANPNQTPAAQPAANAATTAQAPSSTSAAPAAATAPAAPSAATAAPAKPAAKNTAANYEKMKKDVQTINSAITGITKQINPNLAPEDKVKLAREIVNIMADNKKARPQAWQNAYATVKNVLKNVGQQVDATLPKGSQNVTKDLLAALNAGQTRNQTSVNLGKPGQKPPATLGKSSTAKTMGKASPAAATPVAAPGPTGPLRRVAEDIILDNINVYFLNKFLTELDLSWKDIGYTLVESENQKTYTLFDSKVYDLNALLESTLNEYEGAGYSAAEYMWDVIQKQLSPLELDRMPKQKLIIANAVLKWEEALKAQIDKRGEYSGKFDATTQAAFEDIWETVSAVAMAAYRPTSRKPYI